MGWKPLLAIDSAPDAEANLIPPGTGTFEHFVRRFAGDGPINLLKAKGEVHAALRSGGVVPASPSIDDALRAEQIPSVGAGDREDRVLAEIDQDGFAFAADALDESFFNRRLRRKPRQMNLIDIVLIEGHVCIRKRIRELRLGARRWGNRPVPAKEWAYRGLWASLGLYFYSEAAALLRMSDLPFVPKLRCIDFADRALYLDYVPGMNLRTQAASLGEAVHDADLGADPKLNRLSAAELERREVALLERAGGGNFRREIAEMAREINARGVAPLDIKLGNFIRGANTGRLYWIDFEICRLASQPRWEEDLRVERDTLEHLFELDARGLTVK